MNDILDFSKIEARKLDLEIVDFKPPNILHEIVNLFNRPAQDKGRHLVAPLDPQVPHALRGDPSRLRQVLLNLVGNTLKFTQQCEVRLTVQNIDTSASNGARRRLRFSVSDTGVGIHEFLVPNAAMRKSINASGITAKELKRQAVEESSMTTLYWDAMEKVREGRCSIDDVLAKVRIDEFDARPEWMFAELGLSVPDSRDTLPFLGDSTYPHAA